MAANIPLTNTASLTPDTQLASAPISPESRRFLRHVTAATAFGGGLDGFDLGVISVVILHINHDLELTPAMEGLVGAASLLGIFIGAPLFGFLTDTNEVFTFITLPELQLTFIVFNNDIYVCCRPIEYIF